MCVELVNRFHIKFETLESGPPSTDDEPLSFLNWRFFIRSIGGDVKVFGLPRCVAIRCVQRSSSSPIEELGLADFEACRAGAF